MVLLLCIVHYERTNPSSPPFQRVEHLNLLTQFTFGLWLEDPTQEVGACEGAEVW
jgi:hypothetical protein